MLMAEDGLVLRCRSSSHGGSIIVESKKRGEGGGERGREGKRLTNALAV